MAQTPKPRRPDLEKAMAELESVVEQLETGDLTLDKSLKQFERGIRLSRECQAALETAEQKVKMLLDDELRDVDADTLDETD